MTTIAALAATRPPIDPRDREHLLAHVLARPRARIIAHPEATVRPAQAARYRRLLARRARGEPLPYLLGEAWFSGRPFLVTRNVLIPRPETETMIELALDRIANHQWYPNRGVGASIAGGESRTTIMDIGTGSGCIAVTLAAELPYANVIAVDTSPAALRVARANARWHSVAKRITFLRGNLLRPIESILSEAHTERMISRNAPTMDKILRRFAPQDTLLILANLPYLTTMEWRALPRSIRAYEPRLALDGGRDGLTCFRRLFTQLGQVSGVRSPVLLEIDPRRKRMLQALVRKALPGWRASWHRDLAGRWRILELTPRSP